MKARDARLAWPRHVRWLCNAGQALPRHTACGVREHGPRPRFRRSSPSPFTTASRSPVLLPRGGGGRGPACTRRSPGPRLSRRQRPRRVRHGIGTDTADASRAVQDVTPSTDELGLSAGEIMRGTGTGSDRESAPLFIRRREIPARHRCRCRCLRRKARRKVLGLDPGHRGAGAPPTGRCSPWSVADRWSREASPGWDALGGCARTTVTALAAPRARPTSPPSCFCSAEPQQGPERPFSERVAGLRAFGPDRGFTRVCPRPRLVFRPVRRPGAGRGWCRWRLWRILGRLGGDGPRSVWARSGQGVLVGTGGGRCRDLGAGGGRRWCPRQGRRPGAPPPVRPDPGTSPAGGPDRPRHES